MFEVRDAENAPQLGIIMFPHDQNKTSSGQERTVVNGSMSQHLD